MKARQLERRVTMGIKNQIANTLTIGALTLVLALSASAEELRQKVAASKVVDLTHPLYDAMPFWPGSVPFKKTRLVDYDQGYQLHKFEMGENTGTHVDAPSHFDEGNVAIDRLALQDLVVPAVVIDVKDKVADNPDYQLTDADIRNWEAANGAIPAGALVILNTGWNKRFGDPEAYVNADANNVMHFPGYHPDSAAVLIERGIVGVGIDTMSIDFGGSGDFAFHNAMLKAGNYQIENMANLDALPTRGATVIVGVLPVKDGSQAQARILALLP